MTTSVPASAGSGGPDERAAFWAALATRPAASLRPPALVSPQPLRPLPGPLLAKLDVRRRAGYEPVVGADHPRRERLQTAVVVPVTLAALAAVVAVIGFVAGHDVLGIVAAIVAVAAGALALAGTAYVQGDPLRITTDEHRLLSTAGSWQSRQQWSGPLLATPERALVDVAVETVQAIATDPAWTSGYLDGHRLVVDLAAELDAVDAQALQLAQARIAGGADADVARARDACADRVLALQRYRAGLTQLTTHISAADQLAHAAPAVGELRGAVEQTGFAVDGLDRLTAELDVLARAVDTTAAETRRDGPGG